ncbi:MAG: hypothetical protein LBE33_11095 [Zoogloeaceae bacterium]|jgi:hypothetical protein|nr:hypothetical protein [Zoogloeaceae bacterium]
MNVQYFCTLFDSNYLLKGVAMLRSLKENCPEAHIHVLCMDERTQKILHMLDMSFVTCIPLVAIESHALLAAKQTRSVAEYCWTLSPSLPWYVLQNNSRINFITYVDADLLFYSPVQPLFDEIGNASVAIIEHRFATQFRQLEVNGRFCVEWVSFRRDAQGMACLSRWREQCIEWCYSRSEDGRFGDQKYLDEWPQQYEKLHILQHIGAGVAPWNYAQYDFCMNEQGKITINGALLIFYHFHTFQLLDNGKFDRLSPAYAGISPEPGDVYSMYEKILAALLIEIRLMVPDFSGGLKSASKLSRQRWFSRWVLMWIPDAIKNKLRQLI